VKPDGSQLSSRAPAGAGNTRGGELPVLLGRVAKGDRDAFEAVCRHIAAPVFGTVRAVVRDVPQSEEVAQEVLVEVWQCAARFDASRGSALAWVTTIAHRRAVDRGAAKNARQVCPALCRFRTRRGCCDLRSGRMSRLRQDRGLCLFACSTSS
jgi:predicted RNA polymerase sigma factor